MTDRAAEGSRRVLRRLALVALVTAAFLAGMLVERLLWDARRGEMLKRYDRVLQEHRDQQMRSEKAPR